jgi:hypothetical protein
MAMPAIIELGHFLEQAPPFVLELLAAQVRAILAPSYSAKRYPRAGYQVFPAPPANHNMSSTRAASPSGSDKFRCSSIVDN